VPGKLTLRWQTEVADRVTPPPPVLDDGRLYVATPDTHRIVTVDSDSGAVLWKFTAGGRIDSPPTVHEGRVLFGCRDGYVYSLRATDGELVWRLRAARRERRIVAAGQLESVSPVHGSVLVRDGLLYCTAGRSSYLDGGIDLLRVEPESGDILSRTSIYSPDPETGRQPKQSAPSAMPGARSDILSSDGDYVYLRDKVLDRDGRSPMQGSPHLFTLTDYLDDSWTHRSYWIFGERCSLSTGCSGRSRELIYGRLLVFDDTTIYGYGRNTVHWSNQLEDGNYRVFAVAKAEGARRWTRTVPIQARALLLAGDRLFLAGLSCEGTEQSGIFAEPKGERPARLIALSVSTGEVQDQCPLEAGPVFDGLAVGAGRLYVALETGEVACLEGQ
jgi:outer membrane protein assembly factor BamB